MQPRHVTDFYDYANQDQEYVLCNKSRPFSVLVSSNLPTPTSSYLDHHLVQELGLKMTDISCKKLSFAGKKLRILGKVSFTAQCVKDGNVFGTVHFKGSVIEDLRQHFESHAIAGARLSPLLRGNVPRRSSSSSPCSSPPRSPTRSSSTTSPSKSRSPPGFPTTPQYCHDDNDDVPQESPHHTSPYIPVMQRSTDGYVAGDPRSANIASLSAAFANIDLEEDYRKERTRMLTILDKGGDVEIDNSGNMLYFTSSGFSYTSGHGRDKCSQADCLASARHRGYVPNNCGMHKQWALPPGFQFCSDHCRGGYCSCMIRY